MDSYGRTHQFGWDELSLELLVPTPTSCTDSDGGVNLDKKGNLVITQASGSHTVDKKEILELARK